MNHFAVYSNPTDYPDKVVVRRWDICPVLFIPRALECVCVEDTIEAARESIPSDKIRIERCESDDPCIAEVWI